MIIFKIFMSIINEKDGSTTEKSLDIIDKITKEVRNIIKKSRTPVNEVNLMSEKFTDLASKIKQITKNRNEYSIASSLIPN